MLVQNYRTVYCPYFYLVQKRIELEPSRSTNVASQACEDRQMTSSNILDTLEKKELETEQEKTVPGKYYVPYTDIFEEEDALVVVMEIPGVSRNDTEINIDKNILSVEAKISNAKYDGLTPVYTEYNIGHYSRSFSLSNEIDQDGITASTEHGVLTLRLPKGKDNQPRRIEVS
jgi:HSP20 family protein